MLNLITDRTQADVDQYKQLRAKLHIVDWAALTAGEKSLWMNTKGEYRFSDLNRVGQAVAYLAGQLNSYRYPVTVNPITNWTVNDKPSLSQMNAYLSNVKAIKARFYGTTALPAAMSNMTYSDANNIEKLLKEVESYVNGMIASFRSCGTYNLGEG